MLLFRKKWLDSSRAFIGLSEAAFLYGGVAYETLRTYDRKVFALRQHYERLRKTANYLGYSIPYSYTDLRSILEEGVQKVDTESYIRILLLPSGVIDAFEIQLQNTELVIYLKALEESHLEDVVELTVSPIRKIDELATPAFLKVIGRSDILLAKLKKGRYYEALMLGSKGQVCEGTFSNVFLILGDEIVTPSIDCGILPGITRNCVIELCRDMGFKITERWIEPTELCQASEIFLTHTSRGVVCVDRFKNRVLRTEVGRSIANKFVDFIKSKNELWD